jgi:2-amino-4-hydroxy-6-hydroxymethyldihydropteridine diphosphokinase
MALAETHIAYIGLGSNLDSRAGAPAETIAAAFRALESLGQVTARSSLYETAPIGVTEQPFFVNAVAALRTADSPEVLLEKLLAIERDFGRDRRNSIPKGPRTLDLDLLLMNEIVLNTQALTLPHPAIAERRFVLVPLVEIAPDLRHPILQATMRDLLAVLPDVKANRNESVRVLPPRP